jgi:membrane protein DedA with SNARE-associated domain
MSHPLPPNLPGFIQAIAPVVNTYGYWAVGGFIALEDFGTPFIPGESILIAAAVFAGFGNLNIWLVMLVAFVAAIIGDNIGFAIGEFGGRPLVERYGKYILITPQRLDKLETFFNKHGPKIVVIARFIEGLRQFNGIIAGISDMRWPTFIVFNAIGAALWVGLWSMVGFYGGSHIQTIYKYGVYISAIAIVIALGYIAYRVVKKRRAKA